jgi:hypothetical protein
MGESGYLPKLWMVQVAFDRLRTMAISGFAVATLPKNLSKEDGLKTIPKSKSSLAI